MNCGQNGRYPPHPLAKLDELWAERPFPPHRLAKLDELWAERPFPPHPSCESNLTQRRKEKTKVVDKTAVPIPPPE